jgi:DNA-binding response OmpR family regulator
MDRILVIDDDRELCELVAEYLLAEDISAEAVHNGREGLTRALSGKYALVILDVMLPGMNGSEVLRQIRGASAVPVIMLTARGEDVDRIIGLELGADDYLAKPFHPRELVARIHAVLRRTQQPHTVVAAPARLRIGSVELDAGSRQVLLGGTPIDLTTVEFDLLQVLLEGAGSVVSRQDLARRVLGRDFDPFDRSIDVHVSNLRRKLGVGERIKSLRGTGYLYALPGKQKNAARESK